MENESKKPVIKKSIGGSVSRTKKLLLVALEKHMGIMTKACEELGIHRTTFNLYLKDPDFKREVDGINEMALDLVEGKLFEKIKSGDVKSIHFYLKCKGKSRGYNEVGLEINQIIEKQEIKLPDGTIVKF